MRKIEFLGKMPDPFKKSDGTRMTSQEWIEKRDEIRNIKECRIIGLIL